MTRHPVLRGLSQEHQEVLDQCRQLEACIGTWEPTGHRAVRAFLAYWDRTLRLHLELEEQCVLRGIRDLQEQARFRSDANALRNLIDLVRVNLFDPTVLDAYLGPLVQGLRHHVRVSEWELFEDVQDQNKPQHLESLGRMLEEHRRRATGVASPA